MRGTSVRDVGSGCRLRAESERHPPCNEQRAFDGHRDAPDKRAYRIRRDSAAVE